MTQVNQVNQSPNPLNIENMLSTFAFHVHVLTASKPGERYGLHFWQGVSVEVIVTGEGENNVPYFTFDGKSVGNSHGACKEYSKRCAKAFEEMI